MLADDFVRNGVAGQRDQDHPTTRAFHGFAYRLGDLVRLAGRETDAAMTVADGYESIEGEASATFHHLRDAIDGNDVLDQLAAFAITTPTIAATTAVAAPTAAAARTTPAATATGSAARTAAATTTATATRTAAAATTAAATARTAAATTTTAARCAPAWTFGWTL
jgi:hypothetical protein